MFKQIFAITGMNLRSVPERWGPSLVIVIGLAGVVAVFTALLAMAQGFASTLQSAGRADNAIVLRGQSGAELNSGFGRDSMELITLGPGIRKGADGRPLAAGEMMVITELQKQDDPDPKAVANVTLRGVQPASFAIRPQLQVVAGRAFEPGTREVIIGAGVARQFAGTDLGDTSGVATAVLWALLYTVGAALLGLGVGMVVRHSAGAVSGLLVWHPQRDSNPCRHLERVVS